MNALRYLSYRERDLLVLLVCAALLLAINTLWWSGWSAGLAQKRDALTARQADIALFRANKEKLKQSKAAASSGDLFSRLNALADSHDLTLDRLQASGNNRVTLTSSNTPAEKLLPWLRTLEAEGLQLERVNLSVGSKPGTLTVHARVVDG